MQDDKSDNSLIYASYHERIDKGGLICKDCPIINASVHEVFDIVLDLVCIFGFDGYFTQVNPAFERILGFSHEELTSRPFFQFVHPDDVAATYATAQKAFHDGVPFFAFENRFLCKEGSYRWISWAGNPIMEKKTVYSVGRDITELKKMQKELVLAKSALEAKVEERTAALNEVNIALRVLINNQAQDKANMEEWVLAQIRELVLPYLRILHGSGLSSQQAAFINIVEKNLLEITSSFSHRLSYKLSGLTAAEIQIANMIIQSRSTKEIADLLGLSYRTIETHRNNIRKKLNIRNTKVNLRTYLTQV